MLFERTFGILGENFSVRRQPGGCRGGLEMALCFEITINGGQPFRRSPLAQGRNRIDAGGAQRRHRGGAHADPEQHDGARDERERVE